MKPIRWTAHALRSLSEREISQGEADRTIANPTHSTPDPPDREVRMRLYFDAILQQEMLLRVVVEDTAHELVVVTLYKTSKIDHYLMGLPR